VFDGLQLQAHRQSLAVARSALALMVDKITTVPRATIGARVGRLGDEDPRRLNPAILVLLEVAGTSSAAR
jgi:mRNA interferase MazF